MFPPLTWVSRSHFKQSKNSMLISKSYVLGCFVNFWVIFRVYLGGDSFSQRIGKIRRNKKIWRFNVVLKVELEVKN